MALLGIDLGSSGCKAVLFDENGQALAAASAAYAPFFPAPACVEMQPDVMFDAFVWAVRSVMAQAPQVPCAVAISSHGESYVPVLPTGQHAGNMVMNADNRAVAETAQMQRAFGREKIYAITGTPPHPMFGLPKILWHKKRGLYPKGTRFLSAGDYILFRLGLGFVTDYSLASRFLGFDIQKKQWSALLLDCCDTNADELPQTVPAGTPVGRLNAQMCAILCLPAGITVCVGGHDQPCSALGSGVIASGAASISAGSYECIALSSASPLCTPQALSYHLNSYCHVLDGQYITLAFFPAGLAVRWIVEQLCGADAAQGDVYEVLEQAVSTLPQATGICMTPHFVGSCNPCWDIKATAAIAGLTLHHTRHHLYKAVYEGIACELAQNIQVLETLLGTIDAFHISGGGAKAAFTLDLRAAITGKPMTVLSTGQSVCLGAAMLAGVGAGVFPDAAAACAAMSHAKRTVMPDAALAASYAPQVQKYNTLYPSLAPFRAD